eukprot:758159-Hanusia_phi.AAC.2
MEVRGGEEGMREDGRGERRGGGERREERRIEDGSGERGGGRGDAGLREEMVEKERRGEEVKMERIRGEGVIDLRGEEVGGRSGGGEERD